MKTTSETVVVGLLLLPWAREFMYLSGNLPMREAKAPWKTESLMLKRRAVTRVR